MQKLALSLAAFLLLGPAMVDAQSSQSSTMDDVHLLLSFLRDAPIASAPYDDGFFGFFAGDGANILDLGARGGYAVAERVEIGGEVAFRNINPDGGGGRSGLMDIPIFARYNVVAEQETKRDLHARLRYSLRTDRRDRGRSGGLVSVWVRVSCMKQAVICTWSASSDWRRRPM